MQESQKKKKIEKRVSSLYHYLKERNNIIHKQLNEMNLKDFNNLKKAI